MLLLHMRWLHGIVLQLIVLILACGLPRQHGASVAYVSQPADAAEPTVTLLSALQGDAETIFLKRDYSVGSEFNSFVGAPLQIRR